MNKNIFTNSPKKSLWKRIWIGFLGLSIVGIVYLILQFNIIINILYSPLSFIFSFLFTLSFVLFYLDDFKLSNSNIIKCLQIFSFICIPLYLMYNIYYIDSVINIIDYIKDDNDINLHGHVSLDKEAGKAIGEGLNTIGSNIGLGATVAGLGGAVAKGIAKASLPPMQKAGIIIAGGVIGGIIHVAASTINRNASMATYSKSSASKTSDNVRNFIDLSSSDNTSPLEILLECLNILSLISLFLLIILSLQLFYKFFINDKPQLKWIEVIFPSIYIEKVKLLVYKVIKLNKNMSMIYIIMIIILLIISMFTLSYISLELINNLEKYVNVYIEHFKK